MFTSRGWGGWVWWHAIRKAFCCTVVVGDCLIRRVGKGFLCGPALRRRGTIGFLTSFLFSHRSSSIFLLGKCTNANGASLVKTLIGALSRLRRGYILLTPAKETTGIFSRCTRRPTCAVRGGVCHRHGFSGSLSGFSLSSGLRRRALFVISRTSVVTGSKLTKTIFNAKHLLSSLVRCMCTKANYHLVLVKSATRLPPIKRRRDPTLSTSGLHKCNVRMCRTRLARIIHRVRSSKVL